MGKNNIIPYIIMHGSFDTKAVQKFYSFYDQDLTENFSESALYDFSKTGSKGCSDYTDKAKKKSVVKMHKKAKEALEAANAKVMAEFSEENLHRLELAQKLYALTTEAYSKEKADRDLQLQYAESIGQEDVYL